MLPPKPTGTPQPIPPATGAAALPFGMQMPVQSIYVNGFLTNLSTNDVTFVCTFNQIPQIGLAMTHSAAKSFARTILAALERFENESGLVIDDFEETNKIIAKHKSKQGQT